MTRTYRIPYGEDEISFEVPEGSNITLAKAEQKSVVTDVISATKKALLNPINSKKLSDLVSDKSTVCVILTDITRDCPDKEILPPILEELETKVNRNRITLLIASGMHRKMNHDEKVKKYGKEIVENYQIIDHDGNDEKNLISLGTTKNGTTIKISKIAYNSDILISTGVVEPHQYAGYSGGYKTLAIGLAGDETISQTHSRKYLDHPNTRVGNTKGNIFQEDVIEIGKKAGLDFIVNVILGEEKKVFDVRAGEPLATHKTLTEKAKKNSEILITKSFDVAVCGIGFPKDANLYQASRAASYLFYLPNQVVRNGGYIIIPATCHEGAGRGIGEQRFHMMLQNMTIEKILSYSDKFKAGEQRAFMMANVLKNCKVIIVGSKVPEVVKETKMISCSNMDEAFKIIKNELGNNLDVIIIPNSFTTLPIIKLKNI